MVEYTAVAVLFVFITAVFMILAYFSQTEWIKLFMGAMFFLMIVADFNLARVIVEDIAPTKTAFIEVLNTFYIISVVALSFCFVLLLIYFIAKLIGYLRDIPKMTRQNRQMRLINRR